MTASPTYFSTNPPYRSMPAAISRNRAFWKARTSSGSRRSLMAVKPARSAKRTVAGRRSSGSSSSRASAFATSRGGEEAGAGAGGGASRLVPQRGQKAKSAGDDVPQEGHVFGRGRPHFGQKAKSGEASNPQPVHVSMAGRVYGGRSIRREGVCDGTRPSGSTARGQGRGRAPSPSGLCLRRVRNRARVFGAERRPAQRPDTSQGSRELSEVDAVVGNPRGEDVEARKPAEPAVSPRSVERLRLDGTKEVETLLASLAKRRQGFRETHLAIAAFFGPALGLDPHEVARPAHDHAQAGAEVLSLFVAQMANDLHRRPLAGSRPGAGALGVETAEEAVEHPGHVPELSAGIREERRVHALTP